MTGPFDFRDEDGVCCEQCGEPVDLCRCIPGPMLPPGSESSAMNDRAGSLDPTPRGRALRIMREHALKAAEPVDEETFGDNSAELEKARHLAVEWALISIAESLGRIGECVDYERPQA